MNKNELYKFAEVLQSNNKEGLNPESLELLALSEKIKSQKVQEGPTDAYKMQLKENLKNQFKAKRKEKEMNQPIEKVKKPLWQRWEILAPAAIILVLAIAMTAWLVGGKDSDKLASDVREAYLSSIAGTVEAKSADGDWLDAETVDSLNEGSSVRTKAGAKVIVTFDNGSILRLDENSEVTLTEMTEDGTEVEQVAGNSYHRVYEGRNYVVMADGTAVTAKGTAFGVEKNDKVSVPVLDSKVSVEIKKDGAVATSKVVKEGQEGLADEKNEKIEIKDIEKEKLESDWYQWNVERDLAGNYDLIDVDGAEGPELEIIQPKDQEKLTVETVELKGTTDKEATVYVNDEEVENNDGSFVKSITLVEGKNTISIKAVDKDGNETLRVLEVTYEKADEESDEEEKTEEPKGDLALSGSAADGGIKLYWNKYTGTEFKYYKVVRSETNPNLKYPDDGYIAVIKDVESASYFDASVASGKAYYYRICAVKTSEEVICGNVIQVTASGEQSSVSIAASAQATENGVNIFWDVTSGTAPKGFKILVSESPNPSYPGAQYAQYVTGDTRAYTWAGLPHKTLHIRLGAYGDGGVYAYSNDVTVTPTDQNDPPTAVSASASVSASGVVISWTKNNDVDFKYYKVVRSETNPNPIYPADGYIKAASRDELSYVDTQVNSSSTGTYYYTVCSVDQSGQVTRSNVIKVVNGAVQ